MRLITGEQAVVNVVSSSRVPNTSASCKPSFRRPRARRQTFDDPNARIEATNEKQGFMKALIAHASDHIVGFTIIGSDDGQVMADMRTMY